MNYAAQVAADRAMAHVARTAGLHTMAAFYDARAEWFEALSEAVAA